jgi:hypothetical protein
VSYSTSRRSVAAPVDRSMTDASGPILRPSAVLTSNRRVGPTCSATGCLVHRETGVEVVGLRPARNSECCRSRSDFQPTPEALRIYVINGPKSAQAKSATSVCWHQADEKVRPTVCLLGGSGKPWASKKNTTSVIAQSKCQNNLRKHQLLHRLATASRRDFSRGAAAGGPE